MKKFVKILASEFNAETNKTQVYFQAYNMAEDGVVTQTGFGSNFLDGSFDVAGAMEQEKGMVDSDIEVVTDVK